VFPVSRADNAEGFSIPRESGGVSRCTGGLGASVCIPRESGGVSEHAARLGLSRQYSP